MPKREARRIAAHLRNRIACLLTACLAAHVVAGFCFSAESSHELLPGAPIILHESEPGPIQLAVADLQRDLETVLGERSPTVSNFEAAGARPALVVAGPDAAWSEVKLSDRVRGWESHGVYLRHVNDQPFVILHGSDVRGTIYAIYTFSREFLGVEPLWYWAQQPPKPKAAIDIPSDYEWFAASPQVKYRAWFLNDDHRLQAWFDRSPAHVVALGETMLRLKLNTVENYQIGPRGGPSKEHQIVPEVGMAGQRGLVVSSTHISPFGAVYGNDLRDWKQYWKNIRGQEPPELSMTDIEPMKDFWRYHIETMLHHDLEAVWTIAFRGHTDAPFWKTVKDVPKTNEERMAITERMWHEQIELLRNTTGIENPPMRIIFYHELSESLAQGDLKLPQEPSLIWNFVAARRDHFPAEDIRHMTIPPDQLVGYYMNLQFTSTGSHYAQAESPWKMERNFRMVDRLSPTGVTFAVVNAGNVREHLMELSSFASMMWDFAAYDSDRFLECFCRAYFGPDHAEQVADLYRRYYDAYWQQRKPDLEGFERQYIFHDYRLARAIMTLTRRLRRDSDSRRDLNPFPGGDWYRIDPGYNNASSQLEALIKGITASVEKLEQITSDAADLRETLPTEYRTFFDDNLRLQARYLLQASRTVLHLAEALMARTEDRAEQIPAHVEAAWDAANAMIETLKQTEHGPFENWYCNRDGMSPFQRVDEVKKVVEKYGD